MNSIEKMLSDLLGGNNSHEILGKELTKAQALAADAEAFLESLPSLSADQLLQAHHEREEPAQFSRALASINDVYRGMIKGEILRRLDPADYERKLAEQQSKEVAEGLTEAFKD